MGSVEHSRLFSGMVFHKRLDPFNHEFKYSIYMAYIDLDELEHILGDSIIFSKKHKAMVEFRRSDYLGNPEIPLDTAVRQLVEQHTGKKPEGPVRMLTHLRTFGFVFNPVTFYYCFDKNSNKVDTVVAEITNTPWNERHAYVLTPDMNISNNDKNYRYLINKEFHVSPFMEMDFLYDMQFTVPGEKLNVQISNKQNHKLKFVATLKMKQQPFTYKNMINNLIRFPFITIKVITGIYWQALKLKLKGAVYYPNPGKSGHIKLREAA